MTSISSTAIRQLPSVPVVGAPPSRAGTVLRSAAIHGGFGAALGFAASFFGMPIFGGLAAPIAAAIGGAFGAGVGVIKGLREANRNEALYQAMIGARSLAGVGPPPPPTGGWW